MKHCLKCGAEVESDDNFCPVCGHWTTKGYSILKKSDNTLNGKIDKINNRIVTLFVLLAIIIITYFTAYMVMGKDMLVPFVHINRIINSKKYGYNITVLDTNKTYYNQSVNNIEEAKNIILSDFSGQQWMCLNNFENGLIEDKLQNDYNIVSVNFCDMDVNEANKIDKSIRKIYSLFPEIKGYLTNISITNSSGKDDFVAYFQPIYEFVNSTNDISVYNRVNKTQILLNSYYFLNKNTLSKPVKSDWYVKDATWESLIAHEFGHYITYVGLMKQNNIDSTILTTKGNQNAINNIINTINNQSFSKEIVLESMKNTDINTFAKTISNYAASKNSNGEIIYDEIIAEAVHDYYLHNNNASKESLAVINVLKNKLK